MSIRKTWVVGLVVLLAFAALASVVSAQTILGAASASGNAVIFPTPENGLPTPTQLNAALPVGADAHGVAYYGSDNALVTNFANGQIFVVQISTGALLDTINVSASWNAAGTVAVAPGLNAALGCASTTLSVIAAPFTAASTITTVTLPGSIASYQTEAIVFNAAGRAFVYNTAGISVLDPPYSSVAFTIPVANPGSGAIAITPDGNNLLVTTLSNTVQIFSAPYSAGSTPATLTIPAAVGLDGIAVTPNGATALTVAGLTNGQLFAISAPFNASSTVELIPINAAWGSYEDVGISANGQLAILAGNDVGASPDVPFVQAPFTTAGATVNDVIVTGGRGAGAVRFLPPGLAPGLTISKSGPATAGTGTNITYTITYGNTGGADATGVVINDPVPVGTTFVSATGGGVFAAGVVTWNIGTVTAGTTGQTVSFTVTVNATSGTVDNVNYTIEGAGIPPIPGPPVFTQITGGGPTPTPTVPGPTPTPGGGPPAPIPTLSTAMLGLLALALLVIAIVAIRRQ